MPDKDNLEQPTLMHVEPVLAVRDVAESVLYWHDVLGFPVKWTWGEPVNHGGVSWQGVFVQFTLNPELAAASKGNCIWIRVRQLELLYEIHQRKKVEIVEELRNRPWGMADYTVKDINGYYIIFSGAPISKKEKSQALPGTVRIIDRTPSAEEYLNLVEAVGWGKNNNEEVVEKILSAPLFAVVAEEEISKKVIGCALLLGDQVSFYYVKDVMVHPDWQHKQVGTSMLKKLTDWLDENAPENAFVVLITPENLAPFYQQFDFAPVFGMHRSIQSDRKTHS
jgi:N-acetylglutamate synthase-like GNAT family acetyltransferase/catechol 2,3-dioxygenase-like lactoylglutathione lyase family enzyme